LIPIEIKSGRTLTSEAFAGLHKWWALAGDKAESPALIYAGDDILPTQGNPRAGVASVRGGLDVLSRFQQSSAIPDR